MSTPGAPSSQQPLRSLDHQVVLDEDEYTEALSHIIARDFFPSLVHLDATNNYLDALQTQDPRLIQASVCRLEHLQTPVSRRDRPWQTPSQTPYAVGPMDTPIRTPRTERGDGEGPTKRPRLDTDMSLDMFQARYTSEDNSSFTQVLEDENRRRKEKYGWAWDAQRRVEAQRDRMLEGRERLLIEAPAGAGVKEKFRIEAPQPAGLIEAAPREAPAVYEDDEDEVEDLIDGTHVTPPAPQQNKDKLTALVKVEKRKDPDGKAVDVMAPKKDTRPAGVDGWRFKVCCYYVLEDDLHGEMLIVCMTSGTECAHVCPRRRRCTIQFAFRKCSGRVEGSSQSYQTWEHPTSGTRRQGRSLTLNPARSYTESNQRCDRRHSM